MMDQGRRVEKRVGDDLPGRLQGERPVNAMTVDVEDYFQVTAFAARVDRAGWDGWACRVEANTERTLDLLAEGGVRATFFTLGWVAQRYPSLIRRIVAAGHELASHGMDHILVTDQTPEVFFQDVDRCRKLLEDVGSAPVIGYRASTYSIGAGNLWAFDLLQRAGYRYSSSIHPIRHDLYGMPEAPRFCFFPRRGEVAGEDGILEIPITTLLLFNRRIPCGGGGFFRLYPYALSRWAWRRINRHEGRSGVFYFHPWELDPDQPRIVDAPWKSRFRHYLNLRRMPVRLRALLTDFRWDRLDRVFADHIPGGVVP